jgi:hypothetical protein
LIIFLISSKCKVGDLTMKYNDFIVLLFEMKYNDFIALISVACVVSAGQWRWLFFCHVSSYLCGFVLHDNLCAKTDVWCIFDRLKRPMCKVCNRHLTGAYFPCIYKSHVWTLFLNVSFYSHLIFDPFVVTLSFICHISLFRTYFLTLSFSTLY